MLIDSQRILTFHGDTLEAASAMLREQIDALPLTAKVTSLTSGCDEGAFSGMAVVDLIPEVEAAEPGPALQQDVTEVRIGEGLASEI